MANFLRKVKSTFHARIHNDSSSDTIPCEGQAKARSWAHAVAHAHAQSQAEIQAPHAQATTAPSLFFSNHNTTTTSSPDLSIRHFTRRLQKPRSGILTAIPRPPSTEQLYDLPVRTRTRTRVTNPEHPHTFSPFRRRLVHKASTFSLRSKRWTRSRFSTSTPSSRAQEAAREEERIKESILLDEEGTNAVEATCQRPESLPSATAAAPIVQDQAIVDLPVRGGDLEDKVATQGTVHKHQRNFTNTSSISTIRPATTTASSQTEDEVGKAQQEDLQRGKVSGVHQDTTSIGDNQDSIKIMASELSAPPVPYTRLKEITESVSHSSLMMHCSSSSLSLSRKISF